MATPTTAASTTSSYSYSTDDKSKKPRPYPFSIPAKDDFKIYPGLVLHDLPGSAKHFTTPRASPRAGFSGSLTPSLAPLNIPETRTISPLPIEGLSSFADLRVSDPRPISALGDNCSPRGTVKNGTSLSLLTMPMILSPGNASPHHQPSPLRSSTLSRPAPLSSPSISVEYPPSSPYLSPMRGGPAPRRYDIPTVHVEDPERNSHPRSFNIPKSKPKKVIPSPVDTKAAAALPGPQCNVRLIQPDAKIPKFRIGDSVQVRRWNDSTGSYGQWSYGNVLQRVKTMVTATGHTETFYLVTVGDKLSRRVYAAHLGEIEHYDRPPTIAESLIPVEIKPHKKHIPKDSKGFRPMREVVYALVKTPNARDQQSGILTPAYRTGTAMEPWKVRPIVGPFHGYEHHACMIMPFNPDEVASAKRAGLEVIGDGTLEFLRGCGVKV